MEVRVFEKFQKSKKAQNRSQKYSNVFWTCFEAIFMEKFFCPVFHGVFKNFRKIPNFSNIQKCQNRSQFWRNLLWTCSGAIFAKNSFAQCSTDGRAFENFQNNQKNIKIHKLLLIVSKSVQTCLRAILLEKFFCSLFHGFIESFRKKTKNIQNTKNAQNRSQKCPNVFWTCLMAIFPIFFAQ